LAARIAPDTANVTNVASMLTMTITVKISTSVKARFVFIIHLFKNYVIPAKAGTQTQDFSNSPLPPFYHEMVDLEPKKSPKWGLFGFSTEMLLIGWLKDDIMSNVVVPWKRQKIE
jgi:hypothetical protein